jgi:NADPH:quinone reductase-like Zn-dependent oxidoreductase
MRAFVLEDFDSVPRVSDLPTPVLKPRDVLVRVHAASINGFDAAVASGSLKEMMTYEFPVTIGTDFAGVVEAVGEQVTRFSVGDEVLGAIAMGSEVHAGSFAEYVVVPEDGFIAAKPARLGFREAAALPLAGLAAHVAVDAIDPSEGDPVLVVGATGGVGGYAVQLAARRGAKVIATALPEDETYVSELGAAETVDYRGDVTAAVRERYPDGIKGLIDLVNFGEGFAALSELAGPGGRAASSVGAADVEGLAERGVAATNVFAQADPAPLEELAKLAEAGELRIPVQRTYSLDEAGQALDDFANGHVRGKLVVTLTD